MIPETVARGREIQSVVSTGKKDTSLPGGNVACGSHPRLCGWCKRPLELQRTDAKFCGKPCRQASWRFKIGSLAPGPSDRPMTFAYADPPYPGKAFYYPEKTEVDHRSLVDRLVRDYPDGWALSTSARSLRDVLLLCPPEVRVCAWFKGTRNGKARRAHLSWEPLIVYRGRPYATCRPHQVRDGLIAVGKFRAFPGYMIGAKPPAFAEWMFQQLGASRGDTLADLFPGSGAITVAWIRYMGEE